LVSAWAELPANGAEQKGLGLLDVVQGESNMLVKFSRGLQSQAMSFRRAEPAMPRRVVAAQLLRL